MLCSIEPNCTSLCISLSNVTLKCQFQAGLYLYFNRILPVYAFMSEVQYYLFMHLLTERLLPCNAHQGVCKLSVKVRDGLPDNRLKISINVYLQFVRDCTIIAFYKA